MTEERKYYATELTIRILAEGEPWDGSLRWLSHDVTQGEYVGDYVNAVTVELTEAEMAEALVNAGSDPGVFEIEQVTA